MLALAAAAPALAAVPLLAPFSTAAPGPRLPPGWRAFDVPGVPAPRRELVRDGDATVLRVRSTAAAGAAAYALHVDGARLGSLAWRWKIDHVVAGADLARRAGDDFAARVYVFFEIPPSRLPFAERMKLAIARLVHGDSVPSAAICYVWDNRHPVGTSAWNPYAGSVRTVVLESGNARAGRWVAERRDLAADFRDAFGPRTPPAPLTGIAAGNDTDQTGQTATAWFGDFRLALAGAEG